MKEQPITIYLNEQEHSLLSHLSQQEQKSESEIIRIALRKYHQKESDHKSAYDLAQKLGIIGKERRISDLSTNEHFNC